MSTVFLICCLLSAYLVVLALLCVISIPETYSNTFYMIVMENMLNLAAFAMIINCVECAVCTLVVAIYRTKTHKDAIDQAMETYLSNSEKEVPMRLETIKLEMELLKLMKAEFLNADDIDKLYAKKRHGDESPISQSVGPSSTVC
jgi:hypothetical protein